MMASRSDADRVEPRRAPDLLRTWFMTRATDSVDFRETLKPEFDPHSRYQVAYEARFTPYALDRACVEVWVTDDGYVGFGFEQWTRVARRIGRKGGRERFAAGLEPVAMSEDQLLALLALSADGRIGLRLVSVPFVGIMSMRAFVPAGTKAPSGLRGSSFQWLSEGNGPAWPLKTVLTFEAW